MKRAELEITGEALMPEVGFDELVRAEQPRLLRIAWRFTRDPEEARDLVQAALADAFERRRSLRDPSVAAGWLRRILVNRAVNQHRRRKLWTALRSALRVGSTEPVVTDLDAQLDRERRLKLLQRELRALPARQAAAFTLRYLEGLSLDEVAEALGIDRGTVRIHLYRALKKLRALDGWKAEGDGHEM